MRANAVRQIVRNQWGHRLRPAGCNTSTVNHAARILSGDLRTRADVFRLPAAASVWAEVIRTQMWNSAVRRDRLRAGGVEVRLSMVWSDVTMVGYMAVWTTDDRGDLTSATVYREHDDDLLSMGKTERIAGYAGGRDGPSTVRERIIDGPRLRDGLDGGFPELGVGQKSVPASPLEERIRHWLGDESAPYLIPTALGIKTFARHHRDLSRAAGRVRVALADPRFVKKIGARVEHLMPYALRWARDAGLLGGTAWAGMVAEAAMRLEYGLDPRLDALCSFPWALGERHDDEVGVHDSDDLCRVRSVPRGTDGRVGDEGLGDHLGRLGGRLADQGHDEKAASCVGPNLPPLRYYDDVRWRPASRDEALGALEACRVPAGEVLAHLLLKQERHQLYFVMKNRPPSAWGRTEPKG